MDKKEIFIVTEYGGDYDDRYDNILAVFDTKQLAIDFATKYVADNNVSEDDYPMTLDEYELCNFGYADDDSALIDRDGHTKEDFQKMREIQMKLWRNFCGCKIITRVLNSVDILNNTCEYIDVPD